MSTFQFSPPQSIMSAPPSVPNDPNYDSESDGWSSDDESPPESSVSPPVQVAATQAPLPPLTMSEREKLKSTLKLENFIQNEGGYTLYRCEPANQKNPTLTGLSSLKQFDKVHVAVHVFNSEESVFMRTPDMKNKYIKYERHEDGLLVDPKTVDAIRFKKKCQDKLGNDSGFELGKGYMSHTAGATPQFVFVVTPFSNGYIKSQAIRSTPFRVLSKRQERFLQPKQKRRRVNVDLQKYDTDIRNAKTTHNMLESDLRRANIVHSAMRNFFAELRNHVDHVQDETTRLALQFALRCSNEPETASM